MSIVSSSVSADNPITAKDAHAAASNLGFKINPNEVEAHTKLLSAFYETCEEISKLPDHIPPQLRPRHHAKHIRQATAEENEFGYVWSYRFNLSASDDGPEGNNKPGLLAGKNVVLKDNIAVAGVPQSYGTDALRPWTPDFNATIVQRIIDAGGTIIGTATCEAMSTSTSSNTSAAGPIYNPHAWGYSAGGSSSGVGALVGNPHHSNASSCGRVRVDMGIGADQGGSIRVPAAFCGLVGLKPTFGLVPYTGVTSGEPILDHVGPMCKTVRDAALLLDVIAGSDSLDDRQVGAPRHGEVKFSRDLKTWYETACTSDPDKPLLGRKIATLKEATNAPFVTPGIKVVLSTVSQQFAQLGAMVEEVSMPWHETGQSLWIAACRQSLTSAALGNPVGRRQFYSRGHMESLFPWTQEKWEKLPVAMRNEMINGHFERREHPHLYQKAMNLSIRLKDEYEKLFETYDILLLPSVPFTAPALYDRETATPWEILSSTFGQTLNTLQFNLTGHPAMSIPVGTHADMTGGDESIMLPVSVQLVASLHKDRHVLEFGHAYERVFNWTARSKWPNI